MSQDNLAMDGKVLSYLRFMSKVLSGSLADLNALLGVCTQAHSRVSNINFDKWIVLGYPINIPCNIGNGRRSPFSLGA